MRFIEPSTPAAGYYFLVTLEEAIARHRTLADAVLWGLSHTPPLVVAEVIVQDEYTHDVLLPYRDARWIVYDTT